MKRLFAFVFASLVFLLLPATSFAQQGTPDIPDRNDYPNSGTKIAEYLDTIGRGRPEPLPERRVITKGLLAPAESDRLAFAGLLKQPQSGLIRLLPREIYDAETYHTKSPVTIRGGGAYYSFARLTHVYGYGSDIELDHDTLSVGFAGADFGMITDLGQVSLDEVTLAQPYTIFLASHAAPANEPDARYEAKRFSEHRVALNGLTYASRLPVKVGDTYLLRSISYDRSDVLVGLTVFRKDTDGSVVIAWKLLQKYTPTRLIN
jgi:hypothetical protein